MYFKILLLIHILGAIIGFGPAFTFSVLGPLAGRLQGPPALGVMKGMDAIATRLVIPIGMVVQPVSGILLIFAAGLDEGFFSQEWLWIAIVLYAILLTISLALSRPAIPKMIRIAESGGGGSPEFVALRKRSAATGAITTLILLTIIFLMVLQPGR